MPVVKIQVHLEASWQLKRKRKIQNKMSKFKDGIQET